MGCGCNKTSSSGTPSGDGYLLVKATGVGANQCTGEEAEQTDCAKQEPEYDSFLSGFLVPLGSNTISVQVCNSAVYSIGQWIESITPYCIFQIAGVSEGIITVRASLENGDEINVNPEAGTAIPSGTLFVTRGKPQNLTEDEVLAVLNEQEQILVEELIETTDTAQVRFIGVTSDDPGDTAWKKALRMIKGLYVKAGKLFMDAPVLIEAGNNHRHLVRDITTGEIKEAKNDSDTDDVEADKEYVKSVTSTGSQLLETRLVYFLDEVIDLASFAFASGSPPDVDVEITDSAIIGIEKRLQHYYVELTIQVEVDDASPVEIDVLVNDIQIGYLRTDSSDQHTLQFKHDVKIDKDVNEFNFKLTGFTTLSHSYKITTNKIYR